MYKYATKIDNEKNAKALGLALPISTKQSILICNYIRGKSLERALIMLEEVIAMEKPVPYTKFNRDTPHRKGMGPGRYPIKASKEIIKVLNNASSNAQYKGMSVSNLHIKHICAHLASTPWHYGRKTRRKAKRTHLEVVLEEREAKKRKSKSAKKKDEVKPAEKKVEAKKAEPKSKPKTEPKPEVKTSEKRSASDGAQISERETTLSDDAQKQAVSVSDKQKVSDKDDNKPKSQSKTELNEENKK